MGRQKRKASRINLELAPLLGGLFGLRGFFFPPSGESLFLVAVVRAGLFLVALARVAVEKQNFLSVGTAHIASLRGWPRAVKRSTIRVYG